MSETSPPEEIMISDVAGQLVRVLTAEINELIRPQLDHRKAVVFFLFHFGYGRIGHLYDEPAFLRTMFPVSQYKIFGVYGPIPPAALNSTHFRVAMQDIHLVQIEAEKFAAALNLFYGQSTPNFSLTVDIAEYYFVSYFQMSDLFFERMGKGQEVVPVSVPDDIVERGETLARSIGIDPSRPLVTLHVREGGFANDQHFQSYRNGDISTYGPAIQLLTSLGIQVARLGDRTMQRLPPLGPGVFDFAEAPVLKDGQISDGLLEAYLISRSQFLLGMSSGPREIALALKVPMLMTNAPVTWSAFAPNPRDLVVFRDYLPTGAAAPMTFVEITRHPIYDMIDSIKPEQVQISLPPNSPELIVASVSEMLFRLAHPADLALPGDTAFRALVADVQRRRITPSHPTDQGGLPYLNRRQAREHVYLPSAAPWAKVSAAYLAHNPGFLK